MTEEPENIRDRIRDRITDNRVARSKGCVGAILAAVAGCLGIICTGLMSTLPGCPSSPKPEIKPFGSVNMSQTPYSEHVMSQEGIPLRGKSTGPGFSIDWATPSNPNGAQVAQVFDAIRSRVEHLQNTKLGGNETAKLLFELQEVQDLLETRPLLETSYGSSQGGAGFAPPGEIGGTGSAPGAAPGMGSPPDEN